MADENNNNKINPSGLTNRTEEGGFGGIGDGEITPRPRPRPRPNDGHNNDGHHHHNHKHNGNGNGLGGLDGETGDGDVAGGGGPDGGGGNQECFVAGTKVKMSNGLEKNIEDIKIGEKVLSYNVHTKKLELKKVTKLFTQVHDLVDGDITVKTKFNNGVETHNTIANPFWSKDKVFVAADAERCNRLHKWVKQSNKGKDTEQLKVGDTLYHYNGEELQEVMVTEIEHIVEPYIRTYDITIEDNHTFFANGILTHNSGGDAGDTPDDSINTYIRGCFDPGADNYYCDDPDIPTPCYEGCPPDADACLDDGSCTYGGVDTTYSDAPNLLCCLSNTHDGTVRYGGEFPFSDVESITELYYGDSELNVGNVYNAEACNQVDCSIQEFDDEQNLIPKVHFDGHCVNSLGTHGRFGHNIVFDYYYDTILRNFDYNDEGEGDITTPSLYHYPFVRTRFDFDDSSESNAIEYNRDVENENRYFEPITHTSVVDEDTWDDFNDGLNNGDSVIFGDAEYDIGVLNEVFDRFQTGVDKDGTELYNLPIYRELSCQDIENNAGIVVGDYTGKKEDYDLGIGFTKSPFSSGDIPEVDNETYTLGDSHSKGIDFCGGDALVTEAFQILFDKPLYFRIIMNIFANHPIETWFRSITEDTQIPNPTDGFGLDSSGVDDIIATIEGEEYIKDVFINDEKLNRDVLIRIGFPLPPISFNEMDCAGIRGSYLQLVDEFIGEVEALTFFADFQIPNVEIEPTMKNELDVLSGIDLREDGLDACSHIEFMTLPGGNADGDGIYYTGNDIPPIYFDAPYDGNVGNTAANDMTKETYVRTFDCKTELNNNIQFSKMRAVCKDGSSVEMAQAGIQGNGSVTIDYEDPTEAFFNTGVEACNSILKLNSSQELYYLSDNDGKESLGIFFYDSENKLSENFINDKDESFEQYVYKNGIKNGNGRDVGYTYTDASWNNLGWGQIYEAENWTLIDSVATDFSLNHYSNNISPYWRASYLECFSHNKCIVVDTLKPLIQNGVSGYDPRQGLTTFIDRDDLPEIARRKKQKFKLSFMMKTIDLGVGVDLKNTGIHTVLEFDNSKVSNQNKSFAESKIETKEYKTSQCSPYGKNPNHYSAILTEDRYCKQTRASFTNNKINEWQKMEYVFEVNTDNNLNSYKGINLYLTPLDYAKFEGDLYTETNDDLSYLEDNASVILIDNVEFKEAYDFHPDVDVRKKKGTNDYGLVSLTEYYDRFKPTTNPDKVIEEFNDTTAPLEVQFYFYPRFPYDNTLSPNREILLEEFEFKQFYISDVDWGDGSPIEFTTEPKNIGTDVAVYHTYEKSGTYEVQGTMFITVAEEYSYSLNPGDREYNGNLGVGYNKKFRIKININEGLDEDFTYFGTDGFSFIPYKNTLPLIGGYSEQSIYYKSLKRNLGIIDTTTFNNLLVESELLTKDFHGYNGTDGANFTTPAIEVELGGEDGWYKTLRVNELTGNTNTEFLMSNNVPVIPGVTYVESFDLKHDGTIDSLDITFWNSTNEHREVSAIIEDLGIDNDGNFHKRVSAQFTTEDGDIKIRAIDFKNVNDDIDGDFTFLAVKNIRFYSLEDLSNTSLVDVNYKRISDRLQTELAFQKMDDSYNDSGAFDILNYYQTPLEITENTSDEYLATLPFPRYFQEFDILDENELTVETYNRWVFEGRPDIAEVVLHNMSEERAQIGIVGIKNIGMGFNVTLVKPFDDYNSMPLNYELFDQPLLELAISTYACATVFGGDGDFNGGDYAVTQAVGTAIDDDGGEWETFDCIVTDIDEERNVNLPTISESDTYNPPEVYINPTIERQTEQYTGKQFSSLKEQLGKSIGDLDITSIKYYDTPKSIWELLGFEEEDLEQIGTPDNSRYWKNIIPEDYSIYNREGININSSPIIDPKPFYEFEEILSPEYFSGDVIGQLVCAQGDENCQSKYVNGAEAYAEAAGEGFNCPGSYSTEEGTFCNNIDKIYPNTNYNLMTFIPGTVEFCHPLLGCTGFDKGEGIMLEGPMNYDQNDFNVIYTGPFMSFNIVSFAMVVDTYSQQEWLNNYYYPVLPRYGLDGKFIEDDFPNDNIPFSLEGNITDEYEKNQNLLTNLSVDMIDTNVLNDGSGENNKGFVISDYKPKSDIETLENKKIKNMIVMKHKKSNGAF
jgi:hypothetical protein